VLEGVLPDLARVDAEFEVGAIQPAAFVGAARKQESVPIIGWVTGSTGLNIDTYPTRRGVKPANATYCALFAVPVFPAVGRPGIWSGHLSRFASRPGRCSWRHLRPPWRSPGGSGRASPAGGCPCRS